MTSAEDLVREPGVINRFEASLREAYAGAFVAVAIGDEPPGEPPTDDEDPPKPNP